MSSKDHAPSPPEGDRAANRRWIIGLVVSLVFGIFGATMALLSYMDRERKATNRTRRSPAAAPAVAPGSSPPAAPAAPSGDPAHAANDKGKGHDKK